MPQEFFIGEYNLFRKDLKKPWCFPAIIVILLLTLALLGGGLAGMYMKTSPEWLFTTIFTAGVVITIIAIFVAVIISMGYCCSTYCSSRDSFVEGAAEGV